VKEILKIINNLLVILDISREKEYNTPSIHPL